MNMYSSQPMGDINMETVGPRKSNIMWELII